MRAVSIKYFYFISLIEYPSSHFPAITYSNLANLLRLKEIIQSMSKSNRDSLEYLLNFIIKVSSFSSKNQMTIKNLVIVFAPNIFFSSSSESVAISKNIATKLSNNNSVAPEKYLVECMQMSKIMMNLLENFNFIFKQQVICL